MERVFKRVLKGFKFNFSHIYPVSSSLAKHFDLHWFVWKLLHKQSLTDWTKTKHHCPWTGSGGFSSITDCNNKHYMSTTRPFSWIRYQNMSLSCTLSDCHHVLAAILGMYTLMSNKQYYDALGTTGTIANTEGINSTYETI